MKLWHVTQWGNKKDGVNGWDTQCIVAAPDLNSAVEKAEVHFRDYNSNYREGTSDTIFMLGDDGRPEGEARLVVRVWVAFADNLGHYPSWHRPHETNEWTDSDVLFGDKL